MDTSLGAFALANDAPVRAFGNLVAEGERQARLWVASSWRPQDDLNLAGADVSVMLKWPLASTKTGVLVEGIWHNSAIVDARFTVVSPPPPPEIVRAKPSLPSASSLNPDELQNVLDSLDAHVASSVLAIGGSTDALSVQILYVTETFAQWHESLNLVRLDVIPSILPTP